ncbi:MAG: succinylglutamate desuccinylase/aspartoacylase family protein [Cyclobacteriaceae bacterium]|nr:succinylglutamate desuccinylase/aspartoacylase family protein [Cyclobacteriaceae bacterium]
MNRVLGIKDSGQPGPLIILLGAVHGNETTGVHAIINVFRSLEEWNLPFRGKIIGLVGNTKAYEMGERFLDYDLNRCWDEEFVHKLRTEHDPANEQAEDFELLELLGEIEKHDNGKYSTKVLVDLHATSSDNGNFIVIPDDEADNVIVKSLQLPIIIDLEKHLEGTLMEFLHKRGFVAFAFEGGLIGSDRALNLHTSGIWELLYAAEVLERQHDHEFSRYDQIIESFIHALPHKVSVLHRHRISGQDGFRMDPGYHNFQEVKKGEHLAVNNEGGIFAACDGLIFMPLYQKQGDDGFFIVKEIEGRI